HVPPTFSTTLFFLLSHGLPSSTLFPYTTLFRSPDRVLVRVARHLARHQPSDPEREHLGRQVQRGVHRSQPLDPIGLVEKPAPMEDRKSTRLNSSHVKISYAVFCLKKKRSIPTNQ